MKVPPPKSPNKKEKYKTRRGAEDGYVCTVGIVLPYLTLDKQKTNPQWCTAQSLGQPAAPFARFPL